MSAGLRIDDEGRFLVHGEPVTHERTLEVLWAGLSPAPGGGWQVRIGRESAPVDVPGTPYVATSVSGGIASVSGGIASVSGDGASAAGDGGSAPGDGTPMLTLAGGSREPLLPATLRVGRDGVLRATLASGHPVRFSRAAQVALGARLVEDPSAPGGYKLPLGGRNWPVGAE